MLKKVWFKSVRNLDEVVLDIDSEKNYFFYGNNNQGKTNLLESLYFLGNGGSPIGAKLSHLVSFDTENAIYGGEFQHSSILNRIYFKISRNGKKESFINNKRLSSYRNLKRLLNVEFISADIIRIFKESPNFRRQELDNFNSMYFSSYNGLLKQYERVLKQKNKLLKQPFKDDELIFWNKQLIDYGTELVSYRLKGLSILSQFLIPLVEKVFPAFSNDFKITSLFSGYDQDEWNIDLYRSELTQKLNNSIAKERVVGYSLYGPHRDDYRFVVLGKSLVDFYSKGINRSFAILFKLAQLDASVDLFGSFPILLLDDTFAELDDTVKALLLKLIGKKTQFFYTSVIKNDVNFVQNCASFQVKHGVLEGEN